MKRNVIMFTSMLLMISMLGGCGLFPFKEDLPSGTFGKETENTEANGEKLPTEQMNEYTGREYSENFEGEVGEIDPVTGDRESAMGELVGTQVYSEAEGKMRQVLAQAGYLAAQYNYEKAIHLLEKQEEFAASEKLQEAAAYYQKMLESCVEYPLEEITHVFFHILIKDNAKAFDGDSDEAGYNQYMTTISEFNGIIQEMYDRGYVMVSPHDMAVVNEDGSMSRGRILLPPGKIPFVLSQDDTSYYHYMDGDGFAQRLVVNENGEIKAEYIEDDGSVSVGDYDMVPLIDSFVKKHPDFSYHGRKGILALTGYNGLLGYRTDIAYKTGENLQDDQREFLDNHPDFNFEQEVQRAREVAEAMKSGGWEFASHTWGHQNVATASLEKLKADNQRFVENCIPILGETDLIIFSFGADISNWEEYTMDNEKFAYYKSSGYNYYMNVDSSRYWVQITDLAFRQGRRNLDGYRMYYNPEMLEDLFDVSEVWDSDRPTPVPPMG